MRERVKKRKHKLLPILLDFSWLTLYSYPLFLGLAFGVGFRLSLYIVEKYGVLPKLPPDLLITVFISSWIGAKLLFLLVSGQGNVELYASSSSFWFGGGFVFYGGAIFGALAIIVYSFVMNRFNYRNIPLLIPPLCFGHAVGRVGCLLAGCCFGTETTFPISVHLHGALRHPVQLYESLLLLVIGIVSFKMIVKRVSRFKLIMFYLVSYSTVRFTLEFLRGDSIRGLSSGLSTSQYISFGLLVVTILLGTIYKRVNRI
jgi:phosphatidylglycerol:prolipoprotein diacylglycerol transferase